mmetsp:Transcript_2453/g.6293  ORF Transcript_2453/g.6293 Transcript_2453/m.6293 type:complete len:501 (-) Transcript_2453:485-1987(-)
MAWMLLRLFLRKKHIAKLEATQQLKRWARATTYIFNAHTLVLLTASCLSVYICAKLDWRWNMDYSMISTGTVFPLTFTLGQAFTRRERATSLLANLKASVVALYYMHRDWDQSYGYPGSLGNDGIESARRAKQLLMDLCINIRKYLVSPTRWESLAEARLTASRREFLSLFEHDIHLTEKDRLFHRTVKKLVEEDPGRKHFAECYRILSKLSVLNEKLTLASGYTRGGEGGLSRTNQYFRYIISNLEELRTIKEYRTPTMMRHACGVLLHIFAVILAPYFVHFCDSWEAQGHAEQTCAAGYMSAVVYVLIVMLMYHVQQDMENCMDETGLDDAFFTIAEELDDVGGEHVLRSARSSFSDFHMVRAGSPGATVLNMKDMAGHMGMGSMRRSSQDIGRLKTIPSDKMLAEPAGELGMRSSQDLDGMAAMRTSVGGGSDEPSPRRPGLRPVREEPAEGGANRQGPGGAGGGLRQREVELGSPGSDTPLQFQRSISPSSHNSSP